MFKIFKDNEEVADVDSLDISKDDIIVIKMKGSMPSRQIKDMVDKVKDISKDNKIMILPDGYEIGVLKRSQDVDVSVNDIINTRKVLMEDVD